MAGSVDRKRTAPGLAIVPQTTNVLFDLMLSGLLRTFGAGARRISVSLAVLTFIWGAFAFVSVVAGRRAWGLMPVIAMLAYGWVLHMGLFNFYLSLGLCFWALALAWEWKPRRVAAAVPILIVAYAAHGLPVAWTVARWRICGWPGPDGAEARPPDGRLPGGDCRGARRGDRMMSYIWLPQQIVEITGADQLWVFDFKYVLPFLGLLVVGMLLFVRLLGATGAARWYRASRSRLASSARRESSSSPPGCRFPVTTTRWYTSPSACLWPWASACARCWRRRRCARTTATRWGWWRSCFSVFSTGMRAR